MPTLTAEEIKKKIKDTAERIIKNSATGCLLTAPADYPMTCTVFPPQADPSCQLIDENALPAPLRGAYRLDAGLTNIFGRRDSILMGVRACCLWKSDGQTPTVTITGISSKRFSDTRPRPEDASSQHNFGRAFDVKLSGLMKSNGTSYDQVKCALLCLCGAVAGASMVIFSDDAVVNAVNSILTDNRRRAVCRNIAAHENHIHFDNRP